MKNVSSEQGKTKALTHSQAKLVTQMMTGATVREAAKVAGIEERTAHNYLVLPQVKDALQTSVKALTETARNVLLNRYASALELSCEVVVQIMLDAETPAPARLKAAAMIQDRLAPATTSTFAS